MNNIARIQAQLVERNLDALLIFDEKNQRFAAGFPFTDGAVVVGREKAWLLTDSRYIEAAEKAAGDCACVQMFDRQHPLMSLIKAALAEDKDFAAALDEMKAAAEAGKDSTVDLVAKFGRASRLGERSRGVLDAGATSCCIILEAMADGIKDELE